MRFWGVCALMPPPTLRLTNEYVHDVLGRFFSLLLRSCDILSTCMHHRHPQELPGFDASLWLVREINNCAEWEQSANETCTNPAVHILLYTQCQGRSITLPATPKRIWRIFPQAISLWFFFNLLVHLAVSTNNIAWCDDVPVIGFIICRIVKCNTSL